jgi:hypothetical protein
VTGSTLGVIARLRGQYFAGGWPPSESPEPYFVDLAHYDSCPLAHDPDGEECCCDELAGEYEDEQVPTW